MGVDYAKIEKDYMTSSDSLRSLAEKHHVSKSVLCRYAKDHGWYDKRTEIQRKRTDRAIEKELASQDEAWESVKSKMRDTILLQWGKLRQEKQPSGYQVSALTRATRDAREMGAFGAIPIEEQTQEVVIHIDGAGDLSD